MAKRAAADPPGAEALRIQLLGDFRVWVGSQAIDPAQWRLRKARSLIKLLALAPGHELHREQVMAHLWPEQEPKAAANNLHQALHIARRALEPARPTAPRYLQLHDEILGLCPDAPLWIDVEAFEAAAVQARTSDDPGVYRAALDLYTGDLLAEDLYEDWASTRRESLRREHLRLLLALAQLYEGRSEHAHAIETLQQVLARDVAHEEAHVGLMRLHALSGQRQQALRQYQVLRNALRRELEAEPDAQSTRLYQEILAGHFPPPGAPAAARPRLTEPVPEMPTGTVTFLFTDIEGSTQLWEQHPEAMKTAHARQEALLREAMAAHGGYTYKMIGDAFQVAFATAPEALAAALEAQRALHAEPWGEIGPLHVHMALHTGVTEERGDDYVGPVLNRVARLVNVGHGGQVLLTQATYDLVREHLPPNLGLRDLGQHRLKDLVRPEHIYQLVAPDLPSDFPPLKSRDSFPHNLPMQLTSFIGRESEIAEIKRRLTPFPGLTATPPPSPSPGAMERGEGVRGWEVRLLTLTGAGGSGKTRLALQIAAKVLSDFPDGVWFVELAPLSDPTLVPQTVAATLGLIEQAGRPALTVLTDFLQARQALLLLDNCEHVIDACARLAEALLRACPNLRLLATSREALDVPGEVTFPVPTLSTPDIHQPLSPETLPQFEAARLFVERAHAALPGFTTTNDNAPAIAQVCYRLDGIPLAIELAAARLKVLRVEQIASRLDDRFHLLTGGSRTALPRHQTLQALIDWSYDLLSEAERTFLQRLSVFAGGWTLEAAEEVCAEDEGRWTKDESGLSHSSFVLRHPDVLHLLTQLVNKSLVVAERRQGAETRYRLLETIRQYAWDKLLVSGERDSVRRRHLDCFIHLVEKAVPKLMDAEDIVWMDRLEKEHDNLRVALAWAIESTAHAAAGLLLASSLWFFWYVRGYLNEGRGWLAKILATTGTSAPTLARAKALAGAGFLASIQGDFEQGQALGAESLALCQKFGRQLGVLLGKPHLTVVEQNESNVTQWNALDKKSLTLSPEARDKWDIALSLAFLGIGAGLRGDYEQGKMLGEASLILFREVGERPGSALAFASLGWAALYQGDYERATMWLEASLTAFRDIGNKMVSGDLLWGLGHAARLRGDHKRARLLLEQSLILCQETGYKWGIAACLEGQAGVAAAQGKGLYAARLLGAAKALREVIGASPSLVERAAYERDVAAVRAQLDEATFAAAWAEGRAMTMEQAIAYALEGSESLNR